MMGRIFVRFSRGSSLCWHIILNWPDLASVQDAVPLLPVCVTESSEWMSRTWDGSACGPGITAARPAAADSVAGQGLSTGEENGRRELSSDTVSAVTQTDESLPTRRL